MFDGCIPGLGPGGEGSIPSTLTKEGWLSLAEGVRLEIGKTLKRGFGGPNPSLAASFKKEECQNGKWVSLLN